MQRKSRRWSLRGWVINGGRSGELVVGRVEAPLWRWEERREDVLLRVNFGVERMKSERLVPTILCFVSETGGKAICFEEVRMRW